MKEKKEVFPKEYTPTIDFFQTEKAIKFVKDSFEKAIAEKLDLKRVSAPKFLQIGTGLQDDLAGTQDPVRFKTKFSGTPVEIVHSLAKWKRFALGKYGFEKGTGLYTDMDAIRKDEDISPIHSIYVDQWDWEKVIGEEERTIEFLKKTVSSIYSSLLETKEKVESKFPIAKKQLPKEIVFITTQELEDIYPTLSAKEREDSIAKKHKAVFIIGIGAALKSGKAHDVRAADYDDWTLDGDIIVWDDVRGKSLELSSMGIRVDKEALLKQLEELDILERKEQEFHKSILEGKVPLSIGGGIGQSRLCMFLLGKAHLGEVQSSIWPEYVEEEFAKKAIPLL